VSTRQAIQYDRPLILIVVSNRSYILTGMVVRPGPSISTDRDLILVYWFRFYWLLANSVRLLASTILEYF
jgi:hypothetical protein